MRKSQIKQTLLSAFCGPPGLCYSSIKAALLLTLTTLLLILAFNNHSLIILCASFPVSVLAGALLVRAHNKKLAISEFSPSTYIGKVSCQVVGKTTIKRDYHKLLVKARRKNRFNTHANTALGLMCVIVTAFIALPDLLERLTISSQLKVDVSTDTNSLSKTPGTNKIELLNSGRWQIKNDEPGSYSVSLKADEYQNSSEGWYRPELTLSCHNNKTNLVFSTMEILGTEVSNINLSFDSFTGEQKKWKTRADYRSALAPLPISLAKTITESGNLKVAYQTFGTSQTKTANFKLSDSADAVKSVRQKCFW